MASQLDLTTDEQLLILGIHAGKRFRALTPRKSKRPKLTPVEKKANRKAYRKKLSDKLRAEKLAANGGIMPPRRKRQPQLTREEFFKRRHEQRKTNNDNVRAMHGVGFNARLHAHGSTQEDEAIVETMADNRHLFNLGDGCHQREIAFIRE